ncbi:MAG: tetratricopeptide repeat protein [Tumebacillaceae bacterium]
MQTLQFCKQLLLSNNPEQVLQLLSLLESSVTESDSFEAHVEKQLIKASAYVQLGAYDQSEAILSEMQTLPLHDTFVAKLLLVRGYMNTRRGNAAQAITDFQTALQHTEHSKPVELVCLLHMELSQRYKEFDEYGLVIYHVEQTIRHLPEQADDKKHAHLYVELGRIHLKVMSLTAASQALTTAASFHTLQQDLSLQGEILYLMSKVKYFQKDYEHAIQLLESGMQLRQQIGDHAGIAACLLDMAACQLKFEQWEAGETCAQRAVISFENMNDHVQIARAKLLQVEALFHLHGDANRLLSILTAVCNEFEHLQCWLDLAAAHRLKADLLNHLGLCEEALASSMLALQLYKTCEPEHFLSTLQPN